MVLSNVLPATAPTIDAAEARWAASELAKLVRQVGPDSVAGLILARTEQELRSLIPSADEQQREVIGPFRVRVAA